MVLLPMRLLISGDISLNPGPDKCHHCSKGISRKHRALVCSDCEECYHVKYSGANPKQLKSILATNWICNACLLRKLPFSNEVTLNISLECEQHLNYLNTADVDEGPDLANITAQASKRCVIDTYLTRVNSTLRTAEVILLSGRRHTLWAGFP